MIEWWSVGSRHKNFAKPPILEPAYSRANEHQGLIESQSSRVRKTGSGKPSQCQYYPRSFSRFCDTQISTTPVLQHRLFSFLSEKLSKGKYSHLTKTSNTFLFVQLAMQQPHSLPIAKLLHKQHKLALFKATPVFKMAQRKKISYLLLPTYVCCP